MNAVPEANALAPQGAENLDSQVNLAQDNNIAAQPAAVPNQMGVVTEPLAPVAKIPNVFTPDLLRGIANHLDNDASRVIVLAKDHMKFKEWLHFIKQVIINHIPHHKSKEVLLNAVSECEQHSEENAAPVVNQEQQNQDVASEAPVAPPAV